MTSPLARLDPNPNTPLRQRRNQQKLAALLNDGLLAGDGLSMDDCNQLSVNVGDGIEIVGGDVTVDVGDGLELTGGEVAVDLATSSGLEFSAGDLQLDLNPTGGLQIGGSGLQVRTGEGLHLSSGVAVDLAAVPGLEFVSAENDALAVLVEDDKGIEVNANGVALLPYVPYWRRYTSDESDFDAILTTTGDIELFALPAGAHVTHTKIKHSEAYAGPGLASCFADVGTSASAQRWIKGFDVMQVVSDTAIKSSAISGTEDQGSTTSVRLQLRATGITNLAALTAGALTVWMLWALATDDAPLGN